MNKEILNNNSCNQDWEEMRISKKGRFCLECNKNLSDLTEKTIENIVNNHYDKKKCVALTNDQIDFLINAEFNP